MRILWFAAATSLPHQTERWLHSTPTCVSSMRQTEHNVGAGDQFGATTRSLLVIDKWTARIRAARSFLAVLKAWAPHGLSVV
jgi:hypothetical protein